MEMIIYVAIFSMIFTALLAFTGRVNLTGTRFQVSTDLNENAAYFMSRAGHYAREASGLDLADSAFDVDPGRLVLNSDSEIVIDTHVKNVNVGGLLIPVRKIKITQNAGTSVDITSDHVSVDSFVVRNLTQSQGPDHFQIELRLKAIAPDGDQNFQEAILLRDAFTIRSEL